MDEIALYRADVLDSLREPLEDGIVRIVRAGGAVTYPCSFSLIAAMNPCPCGFLGDPKGRCHCTPDQVARYRRRISGPLLDRIDLQVEVPAVPQEDLARGVRGEPSAAIRERVAAARARQLERQGRPNAALATRDMDRYCAPDTGGATVLKQAISRLGLSARAYHRVLKVARTIADLAEAGTLTAAHVAEAIQYRRFDRA